MKDAGYILPELKFGPFSSCQDKANKQIAESSAWLICGTPGDGDNADFITHLQDRFAGQPGICGDGDGRVGSDEGPLADPRTGAALVPGTRRVTGHRTMAWAGAERSRQGLKRGISNALSPGGYCGMD